VKRLAFKRSKTMKTFAREKTQELVTLYTIPGNKNEEREGITKDNKRGEK